MGWNIVPNGLATDFNDNNLNNASDSNNTNKDPIGKNTRKNILREIWVRNLR